MVHLVSVELPRPRCHDGRARAHRVAHEGGLPASTGSRYRCRPGVLPQSVGHESAAMAAQVTLDGHTPSHRTLRLLRPEDPKWKYVHVRSCRYLNNIVEQHHRAIKRRCAWMTGFKSLRNAAILIAEVDLTHRIRKRQFSLGLGRQRRAWSLKQLRERALAWGSDYPLTDCSHWATANAPEPIADGNSFLPSETSRCAVRRIASAEMRAYTGL